MNEAPQPVSKNSPAGQGKRAFEEIVAQLRERLRNETLKPGDRLPSERQLAEQFQLSRNSVREALRMLEHAGLIEIRKGKMGGGFVSQADPDVVARSFSDMFTLMTFSLQDLTEVRLWLTSMISRLACERATDADLSALQANIDRAAKLTAAGEWELRSEVNHEFLDLMAMSTANPIVVALQRSITNVIREIVRTVGPIRDDSIVRSRRRLLRHLRARDTEKAVREMEAHVKKVHDNWKKLGGSDSVTVARPRGNVW